MSDTPEVYTYGQWRRTRSFGLGKFGLGGMVILGGGLLLSLPAEWIAGWVAAVAVAALSAGAAFGFMVPDRHGQSRGQRWVVRGGYWRARSGRRHLYRSGPLGKSLWGTCQLPGLLATTKLTEHLDGYGRPFAVIEAPHKGHYSIGFTGQAQGETLVDRDQVDDWVAGYGNFMSVLAHDGRVIALSVTVESLPDQGEKLRARMLDRIDPRSPQIAQDTVRQLVADAQQGAARVKVWITLTFDAQQGSKKLSVDEFAAKIAGDLPVLGDRLNETGISNSRPITAQDRCEFVRGAFDPEAANVIEDARARGEAPLLRWQDVGPMGHDAMWDHYRHDGAVSVTWAMTEAPRGTHQAHVLRELLTPHREIERKRITIMYRIVDVGQSAQLVAADVRNAQTRVEGSARAGATDKKVAQLAELAEKEEANGATVVDVSMLVTATLTGATPDSASDAAGWIETLGHACKINLRRVYGSQDSAFAANLGLGLVLSEYMALPREFRGGL